MRATCTRTAGVRHLFAAYELGEDKLRTLYPASVRIAIICGNFSPHLTTRRDGRVGAWATVSNVEIACTPTNSSWSNRIEAQFTALRHFARTAPTMPATPNRPA